MEATNGDGTKETAMNESIADLNGFRKPIDGLKGKVTTKGAHNISTAEGAKCEIPVHEPVTSTNGIKGEYSVTESVSVNVTL